MKSIAKGDLFRRIAANRQRLSSPEYRYPGVFGQNSSWPGDWEGRCILGLANLYQAFRGYPKEQRSLAKQLREIFQHLPEYLNQDGYFGDLVDVCAVNEQQVSGNSWFLRGLIEYYSIVRNPEILQWITKITERFLLPISQAYSHYPLVKRDLGGVGGHIEGRIVDGWLTSSDIGCAFIMLDGMSAAYALQKDERLKQAIESIIDAFLAIDFVELECQTHATLSCARGILRFYESTKEPRYLELTESIFGVYVSEGMTLDYSNKNWFGRPETWTEPCCIVDSYLLASRLFALTKKKEYLTLANRIYYNAFRSAQRHNGGAGCNTCLTEEQRSMKGYLFEAFFCCTMRFAEGLRAAKDSAGTYSRNALFLLSPLPMVYRLAKGGSVEIQGDLYQDGEIEILARNLSAPLNVSMYLPSSLPFTLTGTECEFEDFILRFRLDGSQTVRLKVALTPHKEGQLRFVGDMLLVKRKANGEETPFAMDGSFYYYLLDYSALPEEGQAMEWMQEI
ncbi:MAG: glycoside hydrolase family 127 protein [Candidatus Enteromonas sp.]|nr:glycoside hydrolase family 127 protein [Candidatus Enteromonas sp.]